MLWLIELPWPRVITIRSAGPRWYWEQRNARECWPGPVSAPGRGLDISIQHTIACHCQEKLGNIHESWAITMHNDMSLNENWNTSSPTHSPELFVTPTSWRSIALSFTHTLFQLTLTVPLLDNHQCSDNAVSLNSSMFYLLNNPTCYYPRDFPIFQIWWPGQCLVIVQDSWSPVSSFALYLGPEWRVERREWEGGRQRCWAGGGIPAMGKLAEPERVGCCF